MMKKRSIFVFLLIFSLSFVSAIELSVDSEPIVSTIIKDGDKPLMVNFTITNQGPSADFTIFSFERFRIEPNEFSLNSKDSVNLKVNFFPEDSMRDNVGHFKIPIKFREKGGSEIVEEDIFIKLVDFDRTFNFKAENVNPEADYLTMAFYNIEDIYYDDIDLVFSSNFFDDRIVSISLDPFEKKIFSVPMDKDDFKQLVSGDYYIVASYTIDGRGGAIESQVKLLEKSGLLINEEKSGFIINKRTISKHNEGNVPVIADISVKKNIISRLFTMFSIDPDIVERDGLYINYFWQKELQPDEIISVRVITNWIYPLLILSGFFLILYLFNLYTITRVLVRKKVSFVKTKGGEFALKVAIRLKARKFIDKVVLYDRLPAMARLYENYGDSPNHVNKVSGRLQWDVGNLGEGEERIFSYVLYSKMKVIGKFELPSATVMYEHDGKLHETSSNRAFFINDTKEVSDDEY